MTMEALFETYDCTNQILTEQSEKKYILEGICIQQNIKNRNGRIYPGPIMEKEVARYIKEEIEKDRAVGELDHPVGDPRGSYRNVSHKFTHLTQQGDNYIARAVVTKNTPMGKTVAGLMEEGIIMGMSSRAVGSTKQSNGVKVVQENFRLLSAGDVVSDPSAPDAYLTNLMENKEWVWEDGLLVEKEKEIKKEINIIAKQGMSGEALADLFERLTHLKVKRIKNV